MYGLTVYPEVGPSGVSSAPRSSLFWISALRSDPYFFISAPRSDKKSSQSSKLQLDLRIGAPRSTYFFLALRTTPRRTAPRGGINTVVSIGQISDHWCMGRDPTLISGLLQNPEFPRMLPLWDPLADSENVLWLTFLHILSFWALCVPLG